LWHPESGLPTNALNDVVSQHEELRGQRINKSAFDVPNFFLKRLLKVYQYPTMKENQQLD
jgi:hypothetical protein